MSRKLDYTETINVRNIRLKLVTGGDMDTTRVVDAETGQPVVFSGVTASQWHLMFRPGDPEARIGLVLDGVPIEYLTQETQS